MAIRISSNPPAAGEFSSPSPALKKDAAEYRAKIKALPNLIPSNPQTIRAVGRPPSGKQLVTLRLSPEVIAKFKATGKGWQARINEVLGAAKL